jgi:hypothetical protein
MLKTTFILFCLGAGPLLTAESVPPPKAPSDSLSEALPVLRDGFVDFGALKVQPGDRLSDLIARSRGEISVSPAPVAAAPVPSILTANLPGGIIYCRCSSFQPATDWAAFAAQLDQWVGQGAQGIVIDLRDNGTPDDFEGAAQLASFFTPAGTPLFTIRDAQQKVRSFASAAPPSGFDPGLSAEPMAVLIDAGTSGAAEALATCLKTDGALVVGGQTMGPGALMADHRLSSGDVLHYLAGQVVMADGTALWNHPLNPDIGIPVDPKKEKAALALIDQNQVLDVIRESDPRHRMSEAALVRGEDPEIDAYIISSDKKAAAAPTVQDVVLVNALDSLKAIRLSERPEVIPAGTSALPAGVSAER